ncbi:response regulator receiver modulated CheB methylesterase [Petrotoga mobilis SJ95]|uniref:Protein-glutamate methylesterase/protein-glutamine glutaminase n=2 Tax=Petrotoga TaxID=28236 RepID=A9BFG1_PETMO|nr:chemotaxis response regulator protein-glutamate methylesterase [Petrotoga mobilis]ABX30946.1 response regulator receiver modulated CheB methylesterase [Petrotoga mobilis SJ95]
MEQIKILIVDDSAFMRMVLKDIIDKEPDMKVVGLAKDGVEAVEKAVSLKPDVITLDVEMPKKNGLDALSEIMLKSPTRVIMVSSLTSNEASITIECLEKGAFDFIQKPAGSTSWTIRDVQDELLRKIRESMKVSIEKLKNIHFVGSKKIRKSARVNILGEKVVLIASSTGGPRSLDVIIPQLPENLNVPIIIVQHMPAGFTASLAYRLDKISNLKVKEAEDDEFLQKNVVYIAPGDFHLGLKQEDHKIKLFLDKSDKINNVRPSADFTFDLAAEFFKENALVVILTGMGRDGAKGAFKVKHYGGKVIAESKETSVVYGMPKTVVQEGYADFVLPNYDIAEKMLEILADQPRGIKR